MFRTTTVAAVLLSAIIAMPASAQQSDRARSWDFGAYLVNADSYHVDGQGGSSLDVSSELGFGITGSYNFTNRLALGFETSWTTPGYTANFISEDGDPDSLRAELDVFTIHGKGTFNFLEGPITPFVELGIGWTNVDSNIIDGPAFPVCWWDPWWGYICAPFYDTYSETLTSYSAAGGLRWDIGRDYGLRAAYGLQKIDSGGGAEDAEIDTWRLEFVWRFRGF